MVLGIHTVALANETVLWRYPKDDPRFSNDPPKRDRFFIAKDDDLVELTSGGLIGRVARRAGSRR